MKFSISPLLLSIQQSAALWGVSKNTFRKLWRTGIAPPPVSIPGLGRVLFNRHEQEAAIKARSGSQSAKVATSDPTWD